MRIGLYHGYELTGSGSNEYNRYLSRALARRGHEVHVLCREPSPEAVDHVDTAFEWDEHGHSKQRFERDVDQAGRCVVHILPDASAKPVYLTDKQRSGNVKTFGALTEEERLEYHQLCVLTLSAILHQHPLHVLHANHLVYQPVVAAEACAQTGTPWIVFPHGSSIEYVLRQDARYLRLAHEALGRCDGLISGNEEVRDRIAKLYPDLAPRLVTKTAIVGVGVDTSLFQPITRPQRAQAAASLAGLVHAFGKSRAVTRRWEARIGAGQWEAMQDTVTEYDQAKPDADLPNKLGQIDWEQPVLLFVGALTSGKGLQGLIAAMPALLERHPGTQLLIVGAGAYRETLEALVLALSFQDEELLDHLVQNGFDLDCNDLSGAWPDVAAHLADPEHRRVLLEHGPKLRRRIHFLGRLEHDQLRHLFPCADLAVFPSVVPEAYPLVLMESLANGVLPVVSDFSGFADGLRRLVPLLGEEWVDRMKIPIEPGPRVAAITDRLDSLLRDERLPALLPKLREIAVENFDWDIRAAQMEEAYLCLTSRESDPGV